MIDWPALIFSILHDRKWTQERLAKRVGVAPSTLAGWIKCGHEPRYSKGAELMRLTEK